MPRVIAAFTQYFDGEGAPLIEGKLKFTVSGTNATDKDTFADVNEEIPNENPVLLDSEGRVPNVFGTGTYRVTLYDGNDQQIDQFDPVSETVVKNLFADWDAVTVYNVPDIVIGDDLKMYRSLVNSNQGNDPTASPANWEHIEFNLFYNEFKTYQKYDQCIDTFGRTYVSKANDNLGNTPITSPDSWGKDFPTLLDYGGSLENAVTSIGSVKKHLVINCESELFGNLTVPVNITLEWLNGSVISGAFTLTLNCGLTAGLHQIFDDDVTVGGFPRAREVYPEWWGAAAGDDELDDSGFNSGPAINKAILLAEEQGTGSDVYFIVFLTGGVYFTDEKISITENIDFKGPGIIKQNEDADLPVLVEMNTVSKGNYEFHLDGNFENNTTSVISLLIDGCWSRMLSVKAKIRDSDIGYRVYNDSESFNMDAYTDGCAIGGQTGGDTGSPHEVSIRHFAKLCTDVGFEALAGNGITNLELQCDCASAGAVARFTSGSIVLSGMSESSIGGILVDGGNVAAENFTIRGCKSGNPLEVTSGDMTGSVRVEGSSANGVVWTETGGNNTAIDIECEGVLAGPGLEIGTGANKVTSKRFNINSMDNIFAQNILVTNAVNCSFYVTDLATPTDTVSEPIEISADGDDLYFDLIEFLYALPINKDVGASRIVVNFNYGNVNLANVPNPFRGMYVPNYNHPFPGAMTGRAWVNNAGVWEGENFDEATIPNGTTNVVVAHNFAGGAPTKIQVTGSTLSTSQLYAVADATNITITEATGAVPADTTVSWSAIGPLA